MNMFQNIGEIAVLGWRTALALPLTWRHRRKVLDQFFEIGNASLLMVCILAFFIGAVLALQSGPVLVERGLGNYVGGMVGITMCKELAPVMISILIAGRIGSAMAAEIGSMQVYNEIDALRTMNIDPVHYLVLPRILALALALPMLVLFAVMVGWLGGAIVAATNNSIDIPMQPYFENMRQIVELGDVVNGILKSFCFALIVGVVCCHQGLDTLGGPRGIGRSVTKAVVNSILLIVVVDYVLSRVLLNQ
jgi:phospholipid/cholesterol/gamma-HCH transport system permease protein